VPAGCSSKAGPIAIQEQLNGKVGEWMEKVTAEQYAGAAARSR